MGAALVLGCCLVPKSVMLPVSCMVEENLFQFSNKQTFGRKFGSNYYEGGHAKQHRWVREGQSGKCFSTSPTDPKESIEGRSRELLPPTEKNWPHCCSHLGRERWGTHLWGVSFLIHLLISTQHHLNQSFYALRDIRPSSSCAGCWLNSQCEFLDLVSNLGSNACHFCALLLWTIFLPLLFVCECGDGATPGYAQGSAHSCLYAKVSLLADLGGILCGAGDQIWSVSSETSVLLTAFTSITSYLFINFVCLLFVWESHLAIFGVYSWPCNKR